MILYDRDQIKILVRDSTLDSDYYNIVTNLIRNDPYYLTADFVLPYQDQIILEFTGVPIKNYLISVGKSLNFEFVGSSDINLSKAQLSDKYMEVTIVEDGVFKGGFIMVFTVYAIFLYSMTAVFDI